MVYGAHFRVIRDVLSRGRSTESDDNRPLDTKQEKMEVLTLPDEKNIKTLLRSLKWAQKNVEADAQRLEQLRRQLEGAGAVDYSKQFIHGGIPQNMADSVVCLLAYEDNLKASVAKRNKIATRVLSIIEAVEDSRLQLILKLRYRDFKKWEDIMSEMSYSWRQVHRLHGLALKAANRVKDGTKRH